MKMLITLIGLVLILEGLPYVASPEAMQRWLKQLAEMRPDILRIIAVWALPAGLLLCFIAQKSGLFG